ncbi:MAG: LacI family DNA-binding transcriptional regulator [Pseudomonadota bacterium]|uniref:LacI family DNA-binding transcriptional regulator n=1 Tax=Polaromonas sp. TaxID=1869339 RepID=UPI001838463E|nr:LacI family DNA-binding transcriptional regulator [Polaromonas sp.]MBA3593069.1 LacI family DNA-binding transcriptional regulator [Polaromonas sp.]MDQ3271548.1 LacI family DNA-binding transcriptional regulator [Pseudomonadota bacterium]
MSEDATPAARRARRGSGAVTLHEVARLAGVAPITASRALNTPSQVSAELVRRVTEAVASTGYVPNRVAGGLASARSRLVAAMVPTISGPVFLGTVRALNEALVAQGYQLMLGQSGYADSREDALLEAIISRRPDGIVLTGITHSPLGRRRLLASGIPVVETWDLTSTPIDMLVGFSHSDVGRAVVNFLWANGRRRLAMIGGDDERSMRRQQAFHTAAQAAGLPAVPVITVPAPTTLKSGRCALSELLLTSPDVDAVFCSSDLLALGVMTEARVRGVAVPGQLAVVGFGDLEFAADLDPALTTVRIDSMAIGRQAAQFIVDRAEGREVTSRVVDVGFSIVQRDST